MVRDLHRSRRLRRDRAARRIRRGHRLRRRPIHRQRLNYRRALCRALCRKEKYVRQMPGRRRGETVDVDGERGFVLTLSTREQHIRREKATSNICTNSGLCQLAWTIHMSLLGEKGPSPTRRAQSREGGRARGCAGGIPGVEVLTKRFFNEIAVRVPGDANADRQARRQGVIGGHAVSRASIRMPAWMTSHRCATEMNTDNDIAAFAKALKGVL